MHNSGQDTQQHTKEGDKFDQIGKGYQGGGIQVPSFSVVQI